MGSSTLISNLGLKCPFFDPNWGKICFIWPILASGGQKMAILVNALSDLGSNVSFFGPNQGKKVKSDGFIHADK